jgi:hypothetical protein
MTINACTYLSPVHAHPDACSSLIKPIPFPKLGGRRVLRPTFVEKPLLAQKAKTVDSAALKVFEQGAQEKAVGHTAIEEPSTSSAPASATDSSAVTLTPSKFTPEKRIKAQQQKDGRIVINPSPNTKHKMAIGNGFLYSIKIDAHEDLPGHVVAAKRYIGYSECAGRLSAHIFGFNHPEKKRGDLYRDARLHPELLSWGIIRFLKPGEDPEKAETKAILATGSKENGYNIRLGGGGGQSHKSTDTSCPYTIDQVVSMIKEVYQSPDGKSLKTIQRVRKGKTKEVLQHTLSPADKKAQNVVYEILFESPDGDKSKREHHVGQTTRAFGKRISEHLSGVNNPDSQAGQSIPMYKKIRANPSSVRIRVFNVDELVQKGIPLPILETAFMQYFHREQHQKVENLGHGGKGSVARASK